jgi:hypothetical protein
MNRVERRVRDLINPYSTAFASWWCHSARYWRLPRAITGNKTAARPGLPRLAVPRAGGGASEGSGSQYSPSFPQAPNPGERVPCLGSAKPIACDATAGSDLDAVTGSGTMDRREDGTTQPRLLRRRVSPTDQW